MAQKLPDNSSKQYVDLKQEIRSLLISSQKGLTESQLQRDYADYNSKKEIPYKVMGYKSLLDLLRSMPDVARIENNNPLVIHGVADKNTEHLKKMISQQRRSKRTRRSGGSRGRGGAYFNSTRTRWPRQQPPNNFDNVSSLMNQYPSFNSNYYPNYPNQQGYYYPQRYIPPLIPDCNGSITSMRSDIYNNIKSLLLFIIAASKLSTMSAHLSQPPVSASPSSLLYDSKFDAYELAEDGNSTVMDEDMSFIDDDEFVQFDQYYSTEYGEETVLLRKRLRFLLLKYSNGVWLANIQKLFKKTYSEELDLEKHRLKSLMDLYSRIDDFVNCKRDDTKDSSDRILLLKPNMLEAVKKEYNAFSQQSTINESVSRPLSTSQNSTCSTSMPILSSNQANSLKLDLTVDTAQCPSSNDVQRPDYDRIENPSMKCSITTSENNSTKTALLTSPAISSSNSCYIDERLLSKQNIEILPYEVDMKYFAISIDHAYFLIKHPFTKRPCLPCFELAKLLNIDETKLPKLDFETTLACSQQNQTLFNEIKNKCKIDNCPHINRQQLPSCKLYNLNSLCNYLKKIRFNEGDVTDAFYQQYNQYDKPNYWKQTRNVYSYEKTPIEQNKYLKERCQLLALRRQQLVSLVKNQPESEYLEELEEVEQKLQSIVCDIKEYIPSINDINETYSPFEIPRKDFYRFPPPGFEESVTINTSNEQDYTMTDVSYEPPLVNSSIITNTADQQEYQQDQVPISDISFYHPRRDENNSQVLNERQIPVSPFKEQKENIENVKTNVNHCQLYRQTLLKIARPYDRSFSLNLLFNHFLMDETNDDVLKNNIIQEKFDDIIRITENILNLLNIEGYMSELKTELFQKIINSISLLIDNNADIKLRLISYNDCIKFIQLMEPSIKSIVNKIDSIFYIC
ncbi:unnamed protein product [Didymodactylos carnosus]|uniref:HTH OST-type domain-containing protein n=2 Tax=Didymodactylos carnosus TaxID=1234261 RepID=A0A814GBB5_9BILA|nr:unnamed protein product [Didymodactylos carnosus]CAF3764678.1 unnamed protein product [Didymodactylos carnosus]